MTTAPKVLVTGATGMLGSHIVDGLVRRGARVVALDRTPPEPGYAWESEGVEFAAGDITDRARTAELVSGCDVVVHVAAVLPRPHDEMPGPILDVNIVGTHVILEAAARHGRKVVLASSGSVYGPSRPVDDGRPAPPFREPDLPRDLGFYGVSKQVNELHAEAFAREQGLSWTALRCGVMFGPRLRMGLSTRFLLSALDDVAAGRRPRIDGDPDGGLDWSSVTDAAECFVRAALREVPDGPINVSTGRATRLQDALAALLTAAGAPPDIEWAGAAPTGRFSSARYYDSTRAGERLGFRPDPDLDRGMRALVAWRRGR